MIQRIQSVYLFLVSIVAIAIFFTPLSLFLVENSEQSDFYLNLLNVYTLEEERSLLLERPFVLIVINAIVAILSLIALSLFKNRRMQIKVVKLNMLLIIVFLISLFYYFDFVSQLDLPKGTTIYQYGAYLPMFQLVFSYLALRGIKHDEALVRSADRLR